MAQRSRRIRSGQSTALLAALLACLPGMAAATQARPPAAQTADTAQRQPQAHRLPREVQATLDWVRASGNNAGLPFALIDKRGAAVHLFDADGSWQASSPVLLGLARGDHSVPGIGERPIAQIAPHERTTPAGRFVTEPGENLQGTDIVWVDYDEAISMHRVRPTNPAERRLQRLATATPKDNRISYGCINVPARFYDRFVAPTLGRAPGVVYVLPETQSAAAFFGFD